MVPNSAPPVALHSPDRLIERKQNSIFGTAFKGGGVQFFPKDVYEGKK